MPPGLKRSHPTLPAVILNSQASLPSALQEVSSTSNPCLVAQRRLSWIKPWVTKQIGREARGTRRVPGLRRIAHQRHAGAGDRQKARARRRRARRGGPARPSDPPEKKERAAEPDEVIAGADHPRHPGFLAERRASCDVDAAWRGYVARAELASLFAESTVVVVPANASTGSSGVIHRAVAHGRAVLASDLPDFRALADEEDLALDWYAPGDVDALAAALGALLDDGARRDALVRHNLRSLARLTPRRTVDAYLAAFAPPLRAMIPEPQLARLAVEPVIEQ